MKKPTDKQMQYLQQLIKEVEPEMTIPEKCSFHMAQARISWLVKKKNNPAITKKLYIN
jgi:hypothetical protein